VKLVYVREAVADLARLRDFIEQQNPEAALRIARDLVKRIKRLKRVSDVGKPVSEAPDPNIIRDFVFGRYIVRYAVHANVIAVLRIWHHREDGRRG
jgi:plasmid stabilization system protein ParE